MTRSYIGFHSVISDKEPHFIVELTKELNKMLEIETRLLIVFYPQTDEQIEQMNHELGQYLKFFTEYRLTRVVSNGRVYSKQQYSFSNKSIAFYSKLWKRVENRGRY